MLPGILRLCRPPQCSSYHPSHAASPCMQPITVYTNLVAFILSRLDPHKSSGPNVLHVHLLELLVPLISRPLARIVEFVLAKIIPDDWGRAVGTCIYKKGAGTNTAYNRPISPLQSPFRSSSVSLRMKSPYTLSDNSSSIQHEMNY